MKFNSPLISAGSGKIAGIVVSHNSGGQYMRMFRVPVNTNTSFQQAVRNAVSQLQTRFAFTLTNAQRASWAVYAQNMPWIDALGNTIHLTAQNWYIKSNTPRLQNGVAAVDAAPTIYDMATLTIPVPTIVAAGTTVSVAFTNTDAWAGEVGGYLLVYASRPQNNTVNYFNGPYRLAGKVSGAVSPPTSPSVITLPFVIGVAGSKMMFRFQALRASGAVSPIFRVAASA